MVIGETALPIEKQVVHVSSVTMSSNGSSSNRHFCSYHSFGGVTSHETKDCDTQKEGLTTVDPTNPKYQVLKTTGEHFTSRARTPLPNNSSGNKRKGKNGSHPPKPNNPSGKPFWKCVKLNKEGETIPDWITTHTRLVLGALHHRGSVTL